ncbi:MAG: right-handed parallel beta-helix repeat-containing protein [Chloroflexota bacterium]
MQSRFYPPLQRTLHQQVLVRALLVILLLATGLQQADATAAPQRGSTGTTYYVSGEGDDNNDGLSEMTPFRTLQQAANLTEPGDTVLIMNGVYRNEQLNTNIVTIARSGTTDAWITYKAYPGHTPELRSTDNWHAININGAAYIVVDGLLLRGNNANVTEAQAQSQLRDTDNDGRPDAMDPQPAFSGNGIGITKPQNSDDYPHHIVIRNTMISEFGGSGMYTFHADRITIEDNVISDNGWYSPYGDSNISMYQNWDSEPQNDDYRMIIRRNVIYGSKNVLPCACSAFTQVTDGNGIIINDLRNTQSNLPFGPYTGRTLIANNVLYANGGRGINIFSSDYVDIVNNTSYQNSTHPEVEDGEIATINASDVQVYNNILSARADRPVNTVLSADEIVFDYNLVYGGTEFESEQRNNLLNIDPQFIDVTSHNFRLRDKSDGIDAGTTILAPRDDIVGMRRPQGEGIDIGAYEKVGNTVYLPLIR